MFRSDSEENEELGFADAYKYDILKNREPKKDDSYKNLIIILSLVALILGIAIFGYMYINSSTTNSDSVEEVAPPEESNLLNNLEELDEDSDIGDINQTGQIDEVNESSGGEEENYIEDLAKLSSE